MCGYTGVIDDICPRCGRKEGEPVSLAFLKELRKKYPNVPVYTDEEIMAGGMNMTGEELRNADAAANSAVVGEGVKFERIRRITGYLVGTTDRFNDAKRAEEHDRVKHGLN